MFSGVFVIMKRFLFAFIDDILGKWSIFFKIFHERKLSCTHIALADNDVLCRMNEENVNNVDRIDNSDDVFGMMVCDVDVVGLK